MNIMPNTKDSGLVSPQIESAIILVQQLINEALPDARVTMGEKKVFDPKEENSLPSRALLVVQADENKDNKLTFHLIAHRSDVRVGVFAGDYNKFEKFLTEGRGNALHVYQCELLRTDNEWQQSFIRLLVENLARPKEPLRAMRSARAFHIAAE